MRLEEKQLAALGIFTRGQGKYAEYSPNDLAYMNFLVEILDLNKIGFIKSRSNLEGTFYTISEKGIDYFKKVLERAPEIK